MSCAPQATCAELRIQVASFEQKYPACTTFSFSKVVHQRRTSWCNFVPYFEILHHNPTCAYVRTLLLGLCTLRPTCATSVPFLGVVHARTTNVKLLNLFTSCVPQMYIWLSLEPYLRVMYW